DYDLTKPVDVDISKASGSGIASAGSTDAGGGWIAPSIKDEIKDLRELKEFCVSMMAQSRTRAAQIYMELEDEFVRRGVDKTLAQKILMDAFKSIPREKTMDSGYLKVYMRNKMLEKIDVTDPLSRNRIVAFIGPPGVGKTTTIAKLAAIYSLKKKKSIALLTMDTYRIAAAEQIRVYGKIIGVPVEVARNAVELSSFIALHRDKDLILIDTAGRTRKNGSHIRELSEMARICPDIRFNLVLSSQARDRWLYETVKGFSVVPVDSLTFTKLDEADVYGPILNTMMLSRKPLAYLTTGQRVPEDIELATKERLLHFCMPN
ncbi:MAG: hypothetical protein AAB307_03570, partial [Deltaproteobacteria bacterium]